MASTINASTSPAAIIQTADGTADLNLQSNGSTVMALTSSGVNVTGTFNVNGAPISVAGGATTVSQGTSLTLTSASNRVQNVTFTAASLSVTLPDATTLSAGGPTFVIANSGTNTFLLKDSSGLGLVSLSAGNVYSLFLADNSTAAGTWITEVSTIDLTFSAGTSVTTSFIIPSGNYYGNKNNGAIVTDKISSTEAIVTWHQGTGGRDIYGAVLTISSNTFTVGTPTLIYSGSSTAAVSHYMRMYSSTNGMVVIQRPSNMVAVPFTVSGSSITVGSTSSTFAGAPLTNWTNIQDLVGMTSTIGLVCYFSPSNDNGGTALFATITHNGASAPTLGTASTGIVSGDRLTSFGLVKLTSTTAFVGYWPTATSTLYGRVVTISGASAPTLGTAVDSGLNAASVSYGLFNYALSATEVITQGVTASGNWSISGTTVTFNSAYTTSISSNTYLSSLSYIGSIGVGGAGGPTYNQLILTKNITGSGAVLKGFVTLPSAVSFGNSTSGLSIAGLDSSYGIVVHGLGSNSTITAYLIKYIGS